MSKLIDQLAELTGQRDRDILDTTLANAINDLIRPLTVAVYRVVGDCGEERWMTRARMRRGEPMATADPGWIDTGHLPRLADFPQRSAALTGQPTTMGGPDCNVTVFPLATDRETVGVVELVTEDALGETAWSTMVSVLRIFRNFQSLLDYSERDTLTGLLNRKTFDDSFFKVIHGAAQWPSRTEERRSESAMPQSWLAMVDIDFFKSVNDNFGHLIGDEVLLLLSRLMRSTLRFQDRIYRFGGEEFVIVMPCGSERNAATILERLRSNTECFSFPQVGCLTVSIGFTAILPSDSPSSALQRADRSVYHAKANGRNRVCSHTVLVATGELKATENVGDIELF